MWIFGPVFPRYLSCYGSESLFANRWRVPSSFSNNIPAIRASYSVWLLLDLNVNLRDFLIRIPFSPSKMISAPFSSKLEEPSTERIQRESSISDLGSSGVSSIKKSANTCPLIYPRGS